MAEPDSASELEAALERGDVEACLAFFRDMPEKQRRAFAPAILRAYRTASAAWIESRMPGGRTTLSRPGGWEARHVAALVALWSCATLSEIQNVDAWYFDDALWPVLEDRKPAWLQRWAESQLDENHHRIHLVQEAIARGLLEPPQSESYAVAQIYRFERDAQDEGLAPVLRRHPRFLQHDLWRLFELEGTPECSLAGHDKYAKRQDLRWPHALLELSRDGAISRDRLLDASLAALGRDFMQFRAGWFSRLHESLEPSSVERRQRLDAYLRLCASTTSTTVSFAVKALLAIDKVEAIAGDALAAPLADAVLARSKATATGALRLLSRALEREPAREAALAETIARGLLHDKADVQARCLDLLERVAECRAVTARVREAADGIAPSLQPRLARWVGASDATSKPESLRVQGIRTEPIVPIADRDEFFLSFAACLEAPQDPLAVERVLEAIPRYWECEQDLSALAKRARTLFEREVDISAEDPLQRNLARLAMAWAAGEPLADWSFHTEGANVADLFTQRVEALFEARDARSFLLSSPTDSRGFVDAETLVHRACETELACLADRVLALLRLGRDAREAALARAGGIGGEFGDALRHALGASDVPVGPTRPLWVAAARARHPGADDTHVAARHPGLGALVPDCAIVERKRGRHRLVGLARKPAAPTKIAPLEATTIFHQGPFGPYGDVHAAGRVPSLVRWSRTIAPAHTEDYLAVAIERIDLDWWAAQWEVQHFFEVLHDSSVALGPNAYRALALGLAAKEAGQQGAAIDVVLLTLTDGRFDAAGLGAAMAELLSLDLVKAARWAKTLLEVSRSSKQAARATLDTIESALEADPARPPRDLGKLLALLYELATECGRGLTRPAARAYLEAIRTGGKTAQLKKKILALHTGPG